MLKAILKSLFFLLVFPGMIFGKNRTPSTPYITGDGFRAFADFIFDEDIKMTSPARVSSGDVIFLNQIY